MSTSGRYSRPTNPSYPRRSRSRRKSPMGCDPVPGSCRPGTSAIWTCATRGRYARRHSRASSPAIAAWYWSSCSRTLGWLTVSTRRAAVATVLAQYPGISTLFMASISSVMPASLSERRNPIEVCDRRLASLVAGHTSRRYAHQRVQPRGSKPWGEVDRRAHAYRRIPPRVRAVPAGRVLPCPVAGVGIEHHHVEVRGD